MNRLARQLSKPDRDLDYRASDFAVRFVIIISILFTTIMIAESLRGGKLSFPATYDDVSYFNDAVLRLEILYNKGLLPAVASLFSNPPHAPIASLIPLLGFGVFGIRDWAPAAVNVFWVALLLFFIRSLIQDLPRWVFITLGLTALAWPISGYLVVECRPDIYASLLTVMGAALILRTPLLELALSRVAGVAAIFGLALLAKPSVSPITFAVYCLSLACSFVIDASTDFSLQFLQRAAKRIAIYLLITSIICFPYFAFAWREVYNYVYTATVGAEKEIWGVRLSAFDAAGYYLWGHGGQTMMGSWFWITLCLMIVDNLIGFATRRWFNARKLGLFVVFLFAYAVVSVPITKSQFLGVIVPTFFMMFYVMACGNIMRSLSHLGWTGERLQAGFMIALAVLAGVLFEWPNWYPSPPLSAKHQREVVGQIANFIESGADAYISEVITFPVITFYLNNETLRFELLKRHLDKVQARSHLFSFDDQRAALSGADYVILFEEDDPDILRWLPDAKFYSQVRPLVLANPEFEKGLEVPTADAGHVISIYRRKHPLDPAPFYGLRTTSGFLPVEGPYPRWNLPLVRWATGSSAQARFITDSTGAGRLTMRARSPIAGQTIEVNVDGKTLGICELPTPDIFVDCVLSAEVVRQRPELQLRFGKTGGQGERALSVLFAELRLDVIR